MNTPTVTYTEQEINKAVNLAKVSLMSKPGSTFIQNIIWGLNIKITDKTATACTNGIDMLINPNWFMGLTKDERVGLIVHEGWHPALEHMVRGENYDHTIFNIAGDYVINNQMLAEGYTLPPHGYWDKQYEDMTTEQVYNAIYEEFKDKPPPYPLDVEFGGGEGDEEQDGPSSSGSLEERLQDLIVQAAIKTQMDDPEYFGKLPSDLQRRLDDLLNPKLPWDVLLQNFVSACAKIEYSFSRPKKRYTPDFFLPSLSGNTIAHIMCGIDASGSVRDKEFTAFLTEIDKIKDVCLPEKITIVDFDTTIKNIHELSADDDLFGLEFNGYGGTDLTEVFEKALELNPDVFIVFSDLECQPWIKETPFPVIWVVVGNPTAQVSFGQKIDLEIS